MFIIVSILLLVITVIILVMILYRIRQPIPTSSPIPSSSVELFATAAPATDDEYKIINLPQDVGYPDWNQDYFFNITRKYDYLYKLSGLPPPQFSPIPGVTAYTVEYSILFNDFQCIIYPDENGDYEFIEPLPVSLLPYEDMRVLITNHTIHSPGLENHPYPYTTLQGYYKQYPKPISTTAPVDIKLRLYKYPPNSRVPIEEIKTFRIADGTIKALD